MPPSRTTNGEKSGASAAKSLICSFCNREFRRFEHLQRHVRLHTNEKPYGCFCGEGFARRDLLKRHQRIVHRSDHSPIPPNSGVRPTIQRTYIDKPSQYAGPHVAHHETPSTVPFAEEVQSHTPGSTVLQVMTSLSDPLLHGENSIIQDNVGDIQDSTLVVSDVHDAYDPLEDFATFIDSMGLAFDSDSITHPQKFLPDTAPGHDPSHDRSSGASYPDYDGDDRSDLADRAQSPTLLPIPLNSMAVQAAVYMPQLKITEAQRTHILHSLTPFQHRMPEFSLPSRDALTRFLNAYFDGVYSHLPFMHGPSFRLEDHTLDLILAMAACGAQYRYEHRKGLLLFYVAKAVFQERQRQKEISLLNRPHLTTNNVANGDRHGRDTITDDIRCLLTLIIYATWQEDREVLKEAFNLQSVLVSLLRESGLKDENIPNSDDLDWRTWVRLEMDRRVKLFSFAFLNLQTIAYNLPPILLSHELNIRLPATCEEWRALNEIHWRSVRQEIKQEQSLFQNALAVFLEPNSTSHIEPTPSPAANLILIHGLLHNILLYRQSPLSTFSSDRAEIFQIALRRWTSTWQRAPESSLDPLNPNGPVPFTSTALLGLAYTRLQLDLGPCRMLGSRNPQEIASTLLGSRPPVRSSRLLPALLHATHALSIPVKLGIEYVSRSQAFVWSIQHALCGMEFGVLLSKWLHAVSQTLPKQPLEENEQRLLNWIYRVVEEGRTSLDESEGTVLRTLDFNKLAFYVVKLWARIMRGNAQWPFVDIIGQSLDIYAMQTNSWHGDEIA